MRIALVGNPNSGKTSLFNSLTGSKQYVGNWPGVTVERKSGYIKGDKNLELIDLPGIYSLSPYTLEEEVSRNYLLTDRPDCIINIVDGSNLERNLYLTMQVLEIGLPIILAVNMMDVVNKEGDSIDFAHLSADLSCPVVGISALTGSGIDNLLEEVQKFAPKSEETDSAPSNLPQMRTYAPAIEEALASIRKSFLGTLDSSLQRWYAVKALERDATMVAKLQLSSHENEALEKIISNLEETEDDDSESIIISARYEEISKILQDTYKKKNRGKLSTSDKIDRIVTNRWLALPIFVLIMFFVYFLAVHPSGLGAAGSDFVNEGLFGESFEAFGREFPSIPSLLGNWMENINVHPDVQSLVLDGIVTGVGAVLGFLPLLIILFLLLAFLEASGYMARVAFIMDRIFRRFGLSGKSFIPMLISSGCSVPGIMASRTIENVRDRRMTTITTSFVPCGAKLPVIALIAGAFFAGAWWVTPLMYFAGISAVIVSGIMLKKTKMFSGDIAPFVIELPAYHMPRLRDILRSTWERTFAFIKRAGSLILISAIAIWFLQAYTLNNGFHRVENINESMLATIGNSFAWLFAPLGWGQWEAAVATINGLVAKENVVNTFAILYGFGEVSEDGNEIWSVLQSSFTPIAGMSFLVFNLLCAPCFAAIGAMKRELQSTKWTTFALLYQTGLAYSVSLIVYQFGLAAGGQIDVVPFAIACILFLTMMYFLFRPNPYKTATLGNKAK